jgi:hypothetical protein
MDEIENKTESKKKLKKTKIRVVKVRLDDDEFFLWTKKANDLERTLSDLVREAMRRVRVWTPTNKAREKEQLLHIARIGANLNQLAKWVNAYKSSADSAQVIAHLVAIEREIKQIFSPTAQYTNGHNDGEG